MLKKQKFLSFILAILLLALPACASNQKAIYDEFADKPSAVSSEAPEEPVGEFTGELRIGVKFSGDLGNGLFTRVDLIAKEFEAVHPGVKITVEPGITNEERSNSDNAEYQAINTRYTQNRIIELMSGEAPDIVEMNGISTYRYAESGLLCNLYELEDWDKAFPADEYFTNMLKGAGTEKGQFVIPITASPSCLWVNQEVAELLDIDLTAMEAINVQDVLDMYNSAVQQGLVESSFVVDDEMTQLSLVEIEYPDLIDEKAGKAIFDTDSFRVLLEEIKGTSFARTVESGARYTTATGEVKKFDTSTRLISSLDLGRTELLNYKLGTLKAEPILRSTMQGRKLYSGNMYAITQGSKNKELAWEFLKFAVSWQNIDENGQVLCSAGVYQEGESVRKTEYYDERYSGFYPLKRAFAEDVLRAGMGKVYDEEMSAHIMDIFGKADTLYQYDLQLYDALLPVFSDYFDHDLLTAEQCAKKLQDRANIYLQE